LKENPNSVRERGILAGFGVEKRDLETPVEPGALIARLGVEYSRVSSSTHYDYQGYYQDDL
jgi:hypothetical protein